MTVVVLDGATYKGATAPVLVIITARLYFSRLKTPDMGAVPHGPNAS